MEKKKANKTKKRIGVLVAMVCLLLAVGVTAGTTLAKYVSSAELTSTSATVAKWGYTVSATGNMFGQTYNSGVIQATSGTAANGSATIDVSADTANKLIIAPGTGGEVTVTVNGQAEVNAQLKYTFNKSDFMNVFLKTTEGGNSTYYYPIKWYVGGTQVTHKVSDTETNNAVEAQDIINALKAKIEAAITGGVVTEANGVITLSIPANVAISNLDLSIKWEWPLHVDDASDLKDTELGMVANDSATHLAAGSKYEGSQIEVKLGFSVGVEQTQNPTPAP